MGNQLEVCERGDKWYTGELSVMMLASLLTWLDPLPWGVTMT